MFGLQQEKTFPLPDRNLINVMRTVGTWIKVSINIKIFAEIETEIQNISGALDSLQAADPSGGQRQSQGQSDGFSRIFIFM